MVKRLSIFRECLAAFERHFVLIGGAACVEWLARGAGREFNFCEKRIHDVHFSWYNRA